MQYGLILFSQVFTLKTRFLYVIENEYEYLSQYRLSIHVKSGEILQDYEVYCECLMH